MNYRDLGLVYQTQQRYSDALAQFGKALKIEPGHAGTLFNIGMTHAASGNARKGLQYLNRYTQRRSSDEDPLRFRTAERLISKLKASIARDKK